MKVWIVEALFQCGRWEPATNNIGEVIGSDNYYDAHRLKKIRTIYLVSKSTWWTSKKFRVRKYIREEK